MLKLGAQMCWKNLFSNLLKPPVTSACNKVNIVSLVSLPARKTSFFNSLTQEELWKGVVSVSNAGRKKGRGKTAKKKGKRNLNIGQKIGEGKIAIDWPGLNSPVFKGNRLNEIQTHSEKKTKVEPVISKSKFQNFARRTNPLERGWSGKKLHGKKLGPPSPVLDETFEGFETVILKFNSKFIMTSRMGKKRISRAMVATGNGNGIIGISIVNGQAGNTVIKLAQTRASKRLITIDLIDKHTVNHDFCSKYGPVKLLVFKRPEGFGLKCHRLIASLCELIGIENLQVKVEGTCNPVYMTRAFIIGLLRQKTYQQIADETKLHLVEFRKENYDFPEVLASPSQSLTPDEVNKSPVLFEEYIMGGRLLYKPPPKVPFYQNLPSWKLHLGKTLYCRNHEMVRINLLVKYGSVISHLNEIYPKSKKISEEEVEDRSSN